MAKLIGILQEGRQQEFSNRQLPLDVDENLTMIVQFDDVCTSSDPKTLKNKDLVQFGMKFRLLSKDEMGRALTVEAKDLFNTLAHTVQCVGCRRSVERLFNQLRDSGHLALDPLLVTAAGCLTIAQSFITDSRLLWELFYVLGSKLNSLISAIPKNKKNRRCLLHSLETQRSKPVSWLEIWDLMSTECRDKVVLVESDVLLDTLENYLRKHRFCSECKSKVMRAYNILIGRLDSSKEKGYAPHLYNGIQCTHPETQIQLECRADFIITLITRAEPEFRGNMSFSTRERHAKTVENAQEEVLTCLGICLYERLHRIWQRLHEEEQTWQILIFLGVNELRKNFELAIEAKQGFTQLERVCEELSREESVRQQRLEMKRLKRKKKKNKNPEMDKNHSKENATDYECEVNAQGSKTTDHETSNATVCHCGYLTGEDNFASRYALHQSTCCKQCRGTCNNNNNNNNNSWISDKTRNCYSESGYCSTNSNESSSLSSCENSEVASNEGYCDQENDSQTVQTEVSNRLSSSGCERCSLNFSCRCLPDKWACNGTSFRCCMYDSGYGTSLQDMLEEMACSCNDDEEAISLEELQEIQAQLGEMNEQRQQLRQRLRQRFATFKRGMFKLTSCAPSRCN